MTYRFAFRKKVAGAVPVLVGAAALAWLAVAASASSSAAPDLAYVTAQVRANMGVPKFTVSPGAKIDISKLKGKKIFNVPTSVAVPYQAAMDHSMAAAAKLVGIKFVDYSSQGQVSQWVQGVNSAIAQKADLIILAGGINPAQLAPQMQKAKAAGIPVMVAHFNDEGQAVPSNVTGAVFAPYGRSARLEADWTIMDSKGKADVLVVTSNEITPAPGIVKTIQREFSTRCGSSCKVSVLNVPLADWATKVQPGVQSALLKDSKINYVIPIFDSMSQFVVPAIRAAGAVKRTGIVSYNGTPFVLDDLRNGQAVKMDVGEDINWIGWANIDQAMRIMSHMPAGKERTGIRIFDKTNVAQAGNPAAIGKGYGSAYQQTFKKLWGLR